MKLLGGLSFGEFLTFLDTVNVIDINNVDEQLIVAHAERKLMSFNALEMIGILKKVEIIPLSSRTERRGQEVLPNTGQSPIKNVEYVQCPFCRNFHKKINN
jgi:hypothetical protein